MTTSPSRTRGGKPGGINGIGGAGFTLMELMVSVAIISMILLAFGGLLSQSERAVTKSERLMRSNAAASAISRLVRSDIRKITKNGFLRVSDSTLAMVIAGETQSVFDGTKTGDGAIIVYGRHGASNVLYRKVIILSKGSGTGIVDCLDKSLAELQVMGSDEMKTLIDGLTAAPSDMAYPPVSLTQVRDTSWMVLAGDCTGLSVTQRPPGKSSWEGGNTTYTRHNQTNWPDAVKFKFTLKPGVLMSDAIADDPDNSANFHCEIICPVGH